MESLGNIDYIFEGGKKKKGGSYDDESSSGPENYKKAKKSV